MTQPAPFPLIEIGGAPRERGRQYGEQARMRIHASVAVYGDQLGELGLAGAERQRLIDDFAAEIERFDVDYLEEMRGIAEGAGVALGDIVMINARTEVISRARRLAKAHPAPDDTDEDGCTGAVILPERSATGEVIHGQNWDWRAECAETSVVLRVEREEGPELLTFVEAGGLARSGLNGSGLSITANFLGCERDYRHSGVPLSLIRRKVLEQEHMALAMRVVATTPKSGSNNMMLATAEGFAIDFECAPDESYTLYPEAGMIVHANNWLSDVALGKLCERGVATSPDSLYRAWRVRRHLDECGDRIGVDDLKAAFFDDFGSPYSVCRPPRPGFRGDLSATVAMVMMQPARGILEVAPLPAVNREFTHYRLKQAPFRGTGEWS
ncbi:C45 family autoproteolytic acyltransferase/hydolase [Billgrantia endophytica]|uniref:Acyl-CoA--6-aminopenicillanic acid acyltransferase n=1 Tax=Billgrantia endophytica TaxID=2033802 RepID=A0A2N7U700_9GAMM|nr:C45 family peptidase [Halomonas endophytica]PMR76207.1 acyl-CoA--6-aminopenicillanic acid acyltransferase [Halomonas endophytica]